MRFLKEHRLCKKMLIVLAVVLVLVVLFSVKVHAFDGGDLLDVLIKFFVAIADGAITLLQKIVFGMSDSLFILEEKGFWATILAAVVVLGAIAFCVFSGGASLLLLATVMVIEAATGSIRIYFY